MLVHVVFSTKHRADLIAPEIENELFAYIDGITQNNGSRLLAANGTKNHVHLLISLSKTVPLSEIIGDIKRDSSKWIKTKGTGFRLFHWQDGYGAFSVGQSQVETVKQYIARQKQRHEKNSFEQEFHSLLRKYGIEFDERYIWD